MTVEDAGKTAGAPDQKKAARLNALTALREALAKATGHDSALDAAIAVCLGWKWVGLSPRYWLEPSLSIKAFQADPDRYVLDPRAHLAVPIRFTASLDAAVTLVPEGHGYILRDYRDGATSALLAKPPRSVAKGRAVVASTPALALSLARVEYELSKEADHHG